MFDTLLSSQILYANCFSQNVANFISGESFQVIKVERRDQAGRAANTRDTPERTAQKLRPTLVKGVIQTMKDYRRFTLRILLRAREVAEEMRLTMNLMTGYLWVEMDMTPIKNRVTMQ